MKKRNTHKIMDHALKLPETASYSPSFQRRTPMPQHYVSYGTMPNVIMSNAHVAKEMTQSGEEFHTLLVHFFIEPTSYDA